jgi:hypothetical protein
MSTASEKPLSTACRDEAAFAVKEARLPGASGATKTTDPWSSQKCPKKEVDELEMTPSQTKSQTSRREGA